MNGKLIVLNESGDTVHDWDSEDPISLDIVRGVFSEKLSQGHLAYRMEGRGSGVVVKEFDPSAEEIVLAPPMVGG